MVKGEAGMLSRWGDGTERVICEGARTDFRLEGLVSKASSLRVCSGACRKDHKNNCNKSL